MLLLPIEDPWQTLEPGLAAFEPSIQLSRETQLPFARHSAEAYKECKANNSHTLTRFSQR